MSSDDYLDASQKILKLKLNKNQNKEIPLVLVECCLVEKTYNPFYELVAR
jgi:nucleolar MIF4G domain-containing protein 1